MLQSILARTVLHVKVTGLKELGKLQTQSVKTGKVRILKKLWTPAGKRQMPSVSGRYNDDC